MLRHLKTMLVTFSNFSLQIIPLLKYPKFVPDFLKMVATNAIPAEHLENPTAYILQLTVTDGKIQKADIQSLSCSGTKELLKNSHNIVI